MNIFQKKRKRKEIICFLFFMEKGLTLVIFSVLIAASVAQFHMQDTKLIIKEIMSNKTQQ